MPTLSNALDITANLQLDHFAGLHCTAKLLQFSRSAREPYFECRVINAGVWTSLRRAAAGAVAAAAAPTRHGGLKTASKVKTKLGGVLWLPGLFVKVKVLVDGLPRARGGESPLAAAAAARSPSGTEWELWRQFECPSLESAAAAACRQESDRRQA